MSIDFIFAIIFYSLLIILFLLFRKKFTVQNKIFVMYKTKLGLRLMDKMGRAMPRFWKFLGVISVISGFAGMAAIMYMLVRGLITLIAQPAAAPTLGLVLPGVKIPGAPIFVPFWYGIISIFVVAVIHEFFHGVYSRVHNVNVKSSGIAFLGPILAAFVEPEEEELKKRSKLAQLSVFSAGPFSNLLTAGILMLIIIFIAVPFTNTLVDIKGVQIASVEKDFPFYNAGAKSGEIIEQINNAAITDVNAFTNTMKGIKPGETISIKTNRTIYNIVAVAHPSIEGKGYVGVLVSAGEVVIKDSVKSKYGSFLPNSMLWIGRLLVWIFVLSLGIGLVNLLPLGPIDGGRMFYLAAIHFIKDEKKTMKLFGYVSVLCLVLVILNLTFPYLRKLF